MNNGADETALKLFEAFVGKGVEIAPVLPVGQHEAVFQGLVTDMMKMVFTVKFTVADVTYSHNIRYTPKTAEQIRWTFEALAKQFGVVGSIAFEDYNKFIGKTFTVWAVKVEGYSSVFYNYRAPKTTETTATDVTVDDKIQF